MFLGRIILPLFLSCLFISALPAADKKLVIGMDATYPPFETVNAQGEFTGVSVDLGRELGKQLGREVEFRNINFDGLITALKTGSIDIIISSMTANDERRKSIDFSEPYVKTGIALLASTKSTVQNLDDLKKAGRRVVVRLGTTGEQFARASLPDAKLISLDSDTACVMEVAKGGADAWIYDQLSLMNHHAKHPDTTRLLLKPLREEVWAIGLKKGNDELRKQVNDFLTQFRTDGGFKKLGEQYLSEKRKEMEKQGIPFVFDL